MYIVQCKDWKIEVDIDKTKKYYDKYKISDSQPNRNFAKYCESLTTEEKAFFEAFGVNPVCCDVSGIGVDKNGNCPCGGYYYICGKYLEYPPFEVITFEELKKNNFVDTRHDPRVNIGRFQFDFQCEDYEFNRIPDDIPDGFVCVYFFCRDMKWLLSEKPEQMMYEPPRAWEIHKIIKHKIQNKKQQDLYEEEMRAEYAKIFKSLNISAEPLSKKEIRKHKNQWVAEFSPSDADIDEIKKHCLDSREFTPYLWHLFSWRFLDCETDENARELFDTQRKSDCIIISNWDEIAFSLKNADNLNAEVLEEFDDITITASDFSWTYSKTHEEMCGPYFYKK